MPAVTFSDAARALGFKSRSQLYRLRDAGDLSAYLRPPSSTGGAQLLELEPRGLPHLREHVARLIRPQINNNFGERPARQPRTDARWGLAAGVLSDALADCGGLQLSDAEAQAIAAALPNALGEAFGAQGLELLRVALADAGCWQAGPGTPLVPDADARWWAEYGRWEPDEPLADGLFWEHVAPIVGGMMGGPFEQLSGPEASELHAQLGDAITAVKGGARWDASNWAAASVRTLLEDSDVTEGLCPYSLPELQRLAAGGLLPPELQAQADAALARYQANDRQGEPLPVVLS
jgi:hypothetical protein